MPDRVVHGLRAAPAGEVAADRSRVARVEPEHVEHVAEVQTCCCDLNLDFAGCRTLPAHRPQDDVVQDAPLRDL